MEPHAGFAVAIAIGQSTMQDLIRALYVANKVPHTLTLNTSFTASGVTAQVTGQMFFDVPRIRLVASSGNTYLLDLRAWGDVSVLVGGATIAQPSILVALTVAVAPSVAFVGERLAFGLAASTATVQQVVVTVVGGGVAPATVQSLTTSPGFVAAFQKFIRRQLRKISTARMSLGFLGGVLAAPTKTATVRVLDGALAIGIDVAWERPVVQGLVLVEIAPPVDSHGDPSALMDFRGDADLAYWIHAAQMPQAFIEVFKKVRRAVADERANLDSLTLEVHDTGVHVQGAATKDHGTGHFTFDLVPVLTKDQFSRLFDRVKLELRNVDISVTLDKAGTAAHDLGGFFSFGMLQFYIDALIESFTGKLRSQIQAAAADANPDDDEGTIRERNQRIRLPGTKGPDLDLYVLELSPHEAGMFSALSLRPRIAPTRLTGAGRLWADGTARAQVLYAVTLADDVLRSDPQLRVTWTVRRLDTNRAVDSRTRAALAGRTYRADLDFPDVAAPPPLALSCRVYRTLGAAAEEIFAKTIMITDDDRLDRRHPYVRWHANVKLPSYILDGKSSRYILNPKKSTARSSNIHRTELPGRCLFADRYGEFATPEYIDALPVGRDQLIWGRTVFCDYCFFGGPDKNEPLI